MSRLLRRKLVRDAWGMRGRIFMLTMVVMIGTGLSATLFQSYENLRASYDDMYEANQLGHVFITIDQPRVALENPAAAFGGLGFAHVDVAIGRLALDGTVGLPGDDQKAHLVGIPPFGWPQINDICILSGPFDEFDYACTAAEKSAAGVHGLGTKEALFVHAGFANTHQLRVGQPLEITVGGREYDFRVQGFALNSEFLVSAGGGDTGIPEFGSIGVFWARQDTLETIARDLGFAPGTTGTLANEYFVRMTPGMEAEKAERAVDVFQDQPERFEDVHVRLMLVREDTLSFQLAEGDVTGFQQLTPMIAGIVIVIAFTTVTITMERLVTSQRPVIGALRALGTNGGALVAHYLLFAALIGSVGAILGAMLGLWGGYAMSVWYRSVLGFPTLHLGFGIGGASLLGAAAVLACAAGGMRAAIRAARMPITSAMRPSTIRHPSAIFRAFTRRLGLVLKLAVRNLTRAKKRLAFTVSGLTLALVLTFSMIGLTDSSLGAFDSALAREEWDGTIVFAFPKSQVELENELRGVSWIQEVEPFVTVPILVKGMDTQIALVGLVDESAHTFEAQQGSVTFRGADSLLASPGFLSQYESETGESIGVGDTFRIFVDGVSHRVSLDGVVHEFFGAIVYMPRATVQGYLGAPVVTAAYVDYAFGRESNVDDLAAVPGFLALTERQAIIDQLDAQLGTIVAFTIIMSLIGGGLGLVVVLNTAAVSLQERELEHGTLKALGFDDSTLVKILAVENLVVGILAAAIGTALGIAATIALLDVFTAEAAIDLPYSMPLWHMAAMAGAVVLVAQAATLAARRHLQRLDIPAIVKERGS